jgi:hypothetical protein
MGRRSAAYGRRTATDTTPKKSISVRTNTATTKVVPVPFAGKTIEVHQHDIANFMTCPFKYYMTCVCKYKPKGRNKNIDIGDCVAKSVYWLHKGEPLSFCLAYIDKLQLEKSMNMTKQEEVDKLTTNGIVAQGLITGYKEMFLDRATHVTKVEPEYHTKMEFIKFGYKIIVVCRLDGLAHDMWNKLSLLELKTTSRVNTTMVKELPTNFQINTYWLSLLMNNINPNGILYRWMRKPAIRQKKNQTLEQYRQEILSLFSQKPDEYFVQQNPEFKQESIERFKPNFNNIIEELTMCHIQNRWTQRGINCKGLYSLCDMIEYCSNPTKETLETYYEQTTETEERKHEST